jgi:hypothetical protein
MTSDILTKPLAGTFFLHLSPLLLGIAKYVCKRVHLAIRNTYPNFSVLWRISPLEIS